MKPSSRRRSLATTAGAMTLRRGWHRLQYCIVGRHWSFVVPVREADLGEEDLRAAREHRDICIP